MTITISNNRDEIRRRISFKSFWVGIERLLGDSNIVLEIDAQNIKDFIIHTKQAHEFSKDLIQRSYRASNCTNLGSPIDLNKVLDIMGEIVWTMRLDSNDDLLSVELLEEIALHISTYHPEQIDYGEAADKSSSEDKGPDSNIVQFKG